MFIRLLQDDPAYYVSVVLLVGFSICLHELAHAWTALRCGDDTAARAGHLSLNPLIQMGPLSMVVLAVVGIAWGAVPINRTMLSRPQRALVAAAGPAVNLLLCLAFGVGAGLADRWGGGEFVENTLILAGTLNGGLFLLNMLPIPPLDGWSVLGLFIPALERIDPAVVRQVSTMGLIILFMSPFTGYLWVLGGIATQVVAFLVAL